ncbi:hypothetical protein ACFVU3_37855 [Streptomyces sp. NPDC058052]|uniref:hypothetical protein n=1 Tax=Streptomyces sp. NPDC058052 TaxID=3346316 RepID=UPI0036E93051
MRNPIARALIPLLLWLLMLTLPPTGRHRPRPARPARPAPAPRHRAPVRRRSPYAREQAAPLDGSRSPLERPYVTAVQRRRRRTLWLATVGVDVDRRNIHAGAAR